MPRVLLEGCLIKPAARQKTASDERSAAVYGLRQGRARQDKRVASTAAVTQLPVLHCAFKDMHRVAAE